jgi:hypothetical protein
MEPGAIQQLTLCFVSLASMHHSVSTANSVPHILHRLKRIKVYEEFTGWAQRFQTKIIFSSYISLPLFTSLSYSPSLLPPYNVNSFTQLKYI